MMQRCFLSCVLLTIAAISNSVDIEGTLVYESGNPVASAKLRTVFKEPASGDKPKIFSTSTDRDGHFRLQNVPRVPSAERPIAVAVQTAGERVAFVNLTSLTGKVVLDLKSVSLNLAVKDSNGQRLKFHDVEATSLSISNALGQDFIGSWANPFGTIKWFTDKNGQLTLTELPPGANLKVQIRTPKSIYTSIATQLPTSGEKTLVITASVGCILTGQVTKNGEPVAGVRVFRGSRSGRRGGGSYTITDAAGFYKFEGVQPGIARVNLPYSDYRSTLVAKSFQNIELREGMVVSNLNFSLETAAKINIQIVDDKTGAPLSQAIVRILSDGQFETVSVNDDGHLTANVVEGPVEVRLYTLNGERHPKRLWIEGIAKREEPLNVILRVPSQS